MKNIITSTQFGLVALLAAVPVAVFAQAPDLNYVEVLVVDAQSILSLLLPLVVTLALLFFFWGIVVFILNAGDPEGRKRGISIMVWGIVALFVIVGVWGLVGLLATVFDVELGGTAPVPGVGS